MVLALCAAGCATLKSEEPTIRAQSHSIHKIPLSDQQPLSQPPNTAYVGLTLRDAIESALDNTDVIRVLNGRVSLSSTSIYDSMIEQYRVGVATGAFQPSLEVNFEGSQINQPPNAFFGPGISARTQRDTIEFDALIEKPLKTGGQISMGIEPPTAYLYFPEGVDPGEFNPTWSAEYVFRFRQPLLRGAGRRIATAPIQIARSRVSESQWELQEQLNSLIRSVSDAYWQLYAANVEVQAIRAVIPLAEESVRIEKLRFDAEQIIYADLARARFQLEGFRREEARALADVRRRVLQLRQLIGGPVLVEPVLFPVERPRQEEPGEDAEMLAQTAMLYRPSLSALRDSVHQQEIDLNVRTNAVKPQLDLLANYRQSGLAEGLDDAFAQATEGDYADWTVGFGLEVPIGNRVARSRKQISELELTRERVRLARSEQDVRFEVTQIHSSMQEAWQRFQIASRQARDTQQWLRLSRLRYSEPPASSSGRNWMLLELDDYQTAMRSYINSVTDSGQAIADYNILQAEMAQAQGLSMEQYQVEFQQPDDSQNAPVLEIPSVPNPEPGQAVPDSDAELETQTSQTSTQSSASVMLPRPFGHASFSPGSNQPTIGHDLGRMTRPSISNHPDARGHSSIERPVHISARYDSASNLQ